MVRHVQATESAAVLVLSVVVIALVAIIPQVNSLHLPQLMIPTKVERLRKYFPHTVLIEAQAQPHHPERGPVVHCVVANAADALHSQYAINLLTVQNDTLKRSEYDLCFISGSGDNENGTWTRGSTNSTSTLSVEPRGQVQLELVKHLNGTMFLKGINKRTVQMRVTIRILQNGTEVTTQEFLLNAEAAGVDLMTFHAINGVVPSFDYEWKVRPAFFYQQRSIRTVGSNGVTLSIEQRRQSTKFVIFNDRDDLNVPIFFTLNIEAVNAVNAVNIAPSHVMPVTVQVKPHHKKVVAIVRPKRIDQPWDFTFSFDWTSGVSPKQIFGIV